MLSSLARFLFRFLDAVAYHDEGAGQDFLRCSGLSAEPYPLRPV